MLKAETPFTIWPERDDIVVTRTSPSDYVAAIQTLCVLWVSVWRRANVLDRLAVPSHDIWRLGSPRYTNQAVWGEQQQRQRAHAQTLAARDQNTLDTEAVLAYVREASKSK